MLVHALLFSAALAATPLGAQDFLDGDQGVKALLEDLRAKKERYAKHPLHGVDPKDVEAAVEDARRVNPSRQSGEGIEMMLERATADCASAACRAANARRQMEFIAQVPVWVWDKLSAESVAGVLKRADGSRAPMTVPLRGGSAEVSGPQRHVIESLVDKNWARYDKAGLELIVAELKDDADRLRAKSLWARHH